MIHVARPHIGDEERAAVDAVLRSGMIAQGPEVEAFENEFAAYVGPNLHGVALNSGTSALHMGLLACGIGPGDEVLVPSFSFAATGNAVALTGATPVFVDICADDFNMDPAAAEAAVTDKTVAMMPVHLYGHPARMLELQAVCDAHGLQMFEDAAQAHGAGFDGTNVGAFGRMAAFSFYPTKNMTTGEGGMMVTPDADVARAARVLRNQGMERRYENEVIGFNTRMTDISAAIGRVQLGRLPAWNDARRTNAAVLNAGITGATTPTVRVGATPVWHQYTVRSDDRDGLMARLDEAGVGYGVYYPTPIHELPSFGLDFDLPETTRAAREVLSLPCRPDLTEDELNTIITAVNA
jgi:perosamine synthetase